MNGYQVTQDGNVIATRTTPAIGSAHSRELHLRHAEALESLAAELTRKAQSHRQLVSERDAEAWA